MIELGQTVKCRMTGFKGVAEARTEYINGCVQILVRPKHKRSDKEYPTGTYIDIEMLEVVPNTKTLKPKKRKEPSGGIRLHSKRN